MDPHYIKDTLSPLMFDHDNEHKSVSGGSIGGRKTGCTAETLRYQVLAPKRDAGRWPGLTMLERERAARHSRQAQSPASRDYAFEEVSQVRPHGGSCVSTGAGAVVDFPG